jgi:hypothetical protein
VSTGKKVSVPNCFHQVDAAAGERALQALLDPVISLLDSGR